MRTHFAKWHIQKNIFIADLGLQKSEVSHVPVQRGLSQMIEGV